MTVGTGDQFLGQLTPDGKTLVFVANRDIVTEIYAQDVEQGRQRRLFDDGADVTWPRISPDGRHLLYVSFREQAGGQLCVRDLPEGNNRRCLTDTDDANVLQAEWISKTQILMASRRTIQGSLQLSKVALDMATATPLGTGPLLDRNPLNPTVSPDGRWLVYVPVQRAAEPVGPGFAGRARSQLEVLRLDRPEATPQALVLDLPGQSGQPMFSPDGRWLYVVQFFTDSNNDGVIDANDRGVLFRVPFDSQRDDAVEQAARARSDQLTSQAWNCQYPVPGGGALIATCARNGSLSIYRLPEDGQVPSQWDLQRFRTELDMVGRKADEILLYRQRLQLETRPRIHRLLTMRLARLHLETDDFSAAAYYIRRMNRVEDPSVAGLEAPLMALVRHRAARKADEQGHTRIALTGAAPSARKTPEADLDPDTAASPPAAVLCHVVRSEIAQDAGDMTRARLELEAATARLADNTPRGVLEAWYERADAFYRLVNERTALVEAGRRLAAHPAFNEDDQLGFANTAVRALYRGRPYAEADRAMADELARAEPDSTWAFALALGRHINALHEERPDKAVRDALLAFYQQETNPLRRRMVVQDAVARAARLGADGIIERLATLYVADARVGTEEYRRAERLYRRALMGRAYRRLASQRYDEARTDFDLVTRRTGSLESAVESISLRLRAGITPAIIEQEVTTTAPGMAGPMTRFVKAYVIARRLSRIDDDKAHAKAVNTAVAELRAAWPQLKNRREARALQGAIWHEDYVRSGNPASVERANRHYMVALDLTNNNLRYKAMLLGALGVLHTQMGNFHIALDYLEARDKLPYVDNAAGLAVTLARARALLHVDRAADAAQMADRALAMLDATPRLAERYGVLVHDRAAFHHLAARQFERALALYDHERLAPAQSGTDDAEQQRNRVVQRLSRSAAALGAGHPERTLAELDLLEADLNRPAIQAALRPRGGHASSAQTLQTFRLMAAGLRANAHTQQDELEAAHQALSGKRALLRAKAHETGLPEDLRALTLAALQLAENAVDRQDMAQAARYLGEALGSADALSALSQAPVDPVQLNVLWFAAQLQSTGAVVLPFDVAARLSQAHQALASLPRHHPARRTYPAWVGMYLALENGRAEGALPVPQVP